MRTGAATAMSGYRLQCYITTLPDAERVNRAILTEFDSLRGAPELKRTHFFGGRYENLYIPVERMRSLAPVLDAARRGAAEYLGQPDTRLEVGFWLNEMAPGQVTLAHSHDADDELVSGVYYVSVPPDSGELILKQGAISAHVTPQAGEFVFFPPHVVHEVTENRSRHVRLSMGMNFGIRE
jgi:quercetin dioxygenase-like cupin family protein